MRTIDLALLVLVAAGGTATAGPLDKPVFTATPAELLAAAKAAPPGDHDVVILREDVTITYDARGRAERHHHLVFSPLTPSAVDGWGSLTLDWQPFYQDRPTVRARVVGIGGDVTELDPSLLHDAPSVSQSPTVYSDRRDLTAPLPRLAIGAVVEEEFVFTDREPLLPAGTVSWFALGRGAPIARKVITVSAPTALGARVVVRGPALAVKPTVRRAGDRTIITYDLTDVAPSADGFPGTPSDFLAGNFVGIGTGASWAAIATGYRALVEERLAKTVPLPAVVRGPTPRATVDRLVAWLHAQVRYTGIELSDSAIIPFAPADTLARGFGDCKDKATLLVALLRGAGIDADLALLSTGPGWDTDPALPGMGWFDHAIVRAIVDGKDLWIDATEDRLPAGQLPVRDQGRRALIIAAGTRALTSIPTSAPADNRIRERRTYQLAERGAGRVTEVSDETGIWVADLRKWVDDTSRSDMEDNLTHYLANEYQAKLVRFSHDDARDLATPFTLTVEADQVGRTGAMRDFLYVWLFPSDTLDHLPDTFTSTTADFEQDTAERKVDYVWMSPHVYEIVNRIELPPGYSPPDLPPQDVRTIGTMTVTTTRARTANALTITYRLDTGKLRLTADELRATRAAVKQVKAEDGQRIVINLDAATLKGQGKMREAIAEYRRLAALHPKEALHHGQLAQAYLAAGLGDAARREARLGTTIDPGDGDAWMVLGYVLDRDLIGRQWRKGSDRTAAEAAFRKALALIPTHVGAHEDLANLLATDDLGRPTLDPARLREAAGLLRALERDGGARDDRLIGLLGRAGDVDGLTELAQALPDSTRRRVALVTATALRDGGDAALRQLDGLTTTADRAAVLDQTCWILMVGRRYEPLRVLRGTTMASASVADRDTLDRLKVSTYEHLPVADPATPVLLSHARLLFGPRRDSPWTTETEADLAADTPATDDALRTGLKVPSLVFFDFVVAGSPLTIDGDARSGWRIVYAPRGASMTYYVALRKGRAVLLGGTGLPAGIGRELLDAVKRRDLAGARTLIGHLVDDLAHHPDSYRWAFIDRHKSELATAPAALLELIGAMLLVERSPAIAAPILRRCAGLPDDDDRTACRYMAAGAYVNSRQWPEAIEQQRALVAAQPDDPLASNRLGKLLAVTGKPTEVGPVIDTALARHPDDLGLQLARAYAALPDGWSVAGPRFDQLAAPTDADELILNNAAWVHLFYDPKPDVARTLIERVVLGGHADSHDLNTFAAVLAEADEPYAAWQRLGPTMDDMPEPGAADWYVIGRIAEDYGLRDDAVAAYKRAAHPREVEWGPSELEFAQRRLQALGVP